MAAHNNIFGLILKLSHTDLTLKLIQSNIYVVVKN